MEASPQGNRRCFACGKGATVRLGKCDAFGYHFDGSIVYAHLKHAHKALELAALPFGAFSTRDVGFHPETTLLHVSEDEGYAENIAFLEKQHATSRGYAVETKVRRVTRRELTAWKAAGNAVSKRGARSHG